MASPTYQSACETFLDEMVKAEHTIGTYRRAIELFIAWCRAPLASLGAGDTGILVKFTQWLMNDRKLAPASVVLYAGNVRRWIEWMGIHDDLLPADFPLQKALWKFDNAMAASEFDLDQGPPEIPVGIDQIVVYYDGTPLPATIQVDGELDPGASREMLETLRNRTLLYCLAESGGRVSEVLSLRVGDFPAQCFGAEAVWRVRVIGKGNHKYYLRFLRALPRIQDYVNARNAVRLIEGQPALVESAPLFVHHSKRYAGSPMSRQSAWRVINAAQQALGLSGISPHMYRHAAATRLVNSGHPLDVVQDYLGHRTVETTRAHYARTKESRVDDAVGDVMG